MLILSMFSQFWHIKETISLVKHVNIELLADFGIKLYSNDVDNLEWDYARF